VPIGAFLIDRHEVSNKAFAEFVKAGGYEREEFWQHKFEDDGKVLSFSEAMRLFRDATGRPGPAGWRLGSYLEGTADLPVTGISWYEAAAFAEFTGKELPTIYHWYYADTAGDLQLLPGLLMPEGNFAGSGPRGGDDSCVIGAYGAHNMAGNVREWSATVIGSDRITLGGAWSDPSYIYLIPEARALLDRDPATGFRCIQRLDDTELSPLALAPLQITGGRDFSTETPVADDVYEVFERFFETEQLPLEPLNETSADTCEYWTKQQVSFAAGYDGERMLAWLYLPRNASPPYQTIIQMAGAGTFYRRESQSEDDIFGWSYAENLLRSGRAVFLPLWKGSYERADGFNPLETTVSGVREHVIQWVQELRRSVDYLQSRDDIDADRIGYQGISYGAQWAPTFLALEQRLRVGLLLVGGLPAMVGKEYFAPEVDPFNFASRVSASVLMLNGRHDPIYIYETSQVPLFKALGTPEERKRHVTFPAGHSILSWTDHLIRESVDWLDQHFGEPQPGT
jgi:dienelactone hydrolase